jgi:hypothetical protein
MGNLFSSLRLKPLLAGYLAVLWCICLYRAITQSIVHDEAFTFELYLTRGTRWMFIYFDANHHFLNTLLMKGSVWLFGASEWSLRVPALIGAALYFAAVYRLSVRRFQTSLGAVLGVALLTLNPLILDFMVAARGYSLALALWLWAFVLLLEFRNGTPEPQTNLVKAGAALALAITANLTFVVPAAVLAGMALIIPMRQHGSGKELRYYFIIPMAGVSFLFFVAVLFGRATRSHFYSGTSALTASLHRLTEASLTHGCPFRCIPQMTYCIEVVVFFIVPSILLSMLVAAMRRRDPLIILISGSACGSAAVLVILHALAGVPYPVERTGLYFQVLLPLALIALADRNFKGKWWRNSGNTLGYVLAILLAVEFALQFDTRRFLNWEYDADTNRIVDRLSHSVSDPRPNSVHVSASPVLEPSLNFYRRTRRLVWMKDVNRAPLAAGANFYVLTTEDRSAIRTLGLRPIYEGEISGTILAVSLQP